MAGDREPIAAKALGLDLEPEDTSSTIESEVAGSSSIKPNVIDTFVSGVVGSQPSVGDIAPGVPPDVLLWARETAGLDKRPRNKIDDIPTEIKGVSLRVIRGTDASGINGETILLLDDLGREGMWIEQQHEERLPEIKEDFNNITAELGVLGIHRDTNNGNFNVTSVSERHPKFDDVAIRDSLDPHETKKVYVPKTTITFVFDGDLQVDGSVLKSEQVFRILRHALLGAGVNEILLDNGSLTKKTEEQRREKVLAALIASGVNIKGVTIEFSRRVELDDVDKNRAIKVTRPRRRRKNLVEKKSDKKALEDIVMGSDSNTGDIEEPLRHDPQFSTELV